VPKLKPFTPSLIPTAAVLILALAGCQDDTRRAGEKPRDDRPNQGIDQRANQPENRPGRVESPDQRDAQQPQPGTTSGGTTSGGTTSGGTTSGGTTTKGTTTGDKTTGNTTDQDDQ
jgi:hypothetical protein